MVSEYLLEAKKNNEIKYIEVKAEKPERLKAERAIVHFISTVDLDRQRDVMMPKGMIDTDFAKSPSVFFNHEYMFNSHALPIAKSIWRKRQEEGVLAKTQFATTEFADDVYMLHEGEFMNTWSIGFRPAKDKTGSIEKDSIIHDEKKNITTWHKWDLLEYSSAPIAANPNAGDMAKDLLGINFKSSAMADMVKTTILELDIKSQLATMQSQINELNNLKSYFDELIQGVKEGVELHEKEIIELAELIKNKENKIVKEITIEMPVNSFNSEKIANLAKQAVNGGISRSNKK